MPDAMRQTAEVLARKHVKDRATIRALRKELKLALEAVRSHADELDEVREVADRWRGNAVQLGGQLESLEKDVKDTRAIATEVKALAATQQHEVDVLRSEFNETQRLITARDTEIARLHEVVRTAEERVAQYEDDLPALRTHIAKAWLGLVNMRDVDAAGALLLDRVRGELEVAATLPMVTPRFPRDGYGDRTMTDAALVIASNGGASRRRREQGGKSR